MEWRSCARRQSWSHRSTARGRRLYRAPAEVAKGRGPAELTQSFRVHRAVASHHRTDIGRVSRANFAENALDFRTGVPEGRRSCGQRPGHHDPHLISVCGHDPGSRPGNAGEIWAREVLLSDCRPTSAVNRRDADATAEVNRAIRSNARLGGTTLDPIAGGARRNRVTTRRLRVATSATRIGRPVRGVVTGVVASAVPAPSVPPVVVITVGAPADITRPPGPVHPGRAPIITPGPGPTTAHREVP